MRVANTKKATQDVKERNVQEEDKAGEKSCSSWDLTEKSSNSVSQNE